MNVTYVIVVIAMVILSAFFSGSEISFNVSNKMRLRRAAEEGSRTAKAALKICDDFNTALCAILVGNNLANIASSTCATTICLALIADDGVAATVATVVMTVIVLIFGEITPKIIAKQNSDIIVRAVSFPIRILIIILYPIVILVLGLIWILRKLWGKDSDGTPDITEEELSSIIDTVEREGVIDEDQGELLQSSLEFSDTTIEEIMTPRIDLLTLDINSDDETKHSILNSSTYSRIPVYNESIDDIIGILYLNHYYKEAVEKPSVNIERLLIKPCFLHKTMRLPAALRRLRERRTHMAIVIDEFGGTLGVVTIEDILEEIVGDIWDESDEIISPLICIAPNKYEVLGEMNIDDLFHELDFHPTNFECEYSTVGGWAVQSLNSDPRVGDWFSYEFLDILVAEMEDGVRVTKLLVTVGERPTDDEEET